MADKTFGGGGARNPNSLANLERGEATRFTRGEVAANAARNAGRAAAENRRKTKTMREAVKVLLDIATTDEQRAAALRAMGLEPSNRNAATFAMVEKALNGSEKAYEVLRDTAGEQPKLQVGLSAEDAMTADDLRKLSDAELASLVDGGSNDA